MSSILVAAALAASVTNLCSKGAIDTVQCMKAHSRAGYTVSLQNCKAAGDVANIYMPGPGDKPVLVKSQKIKSEPIDPHKMGAPKLYSGTNFKLSVNWTTAPIQGSAHAGSLQALVGKDKISEDVACVMTR